MSDDPRTDFFSSGASAAQDAPSADDDARTNFFSTGKIPQSAATPTEVKTTEPVYNADLFRKRVGRDPNPTELANFAANKGEGWANSENYGGSFKGMGEAALQFGASSLKAINRAVNDILPDWGGSKAQAEREIATDPILNYQGGPESKQYTEGIRKALTPVTWAAQKAHDAIASIAGNRTADIVGDIATLAPAARGYIPSGRQIIDSMDDPEAGLTGITDAASNAHRSMGAAAATPNLNGVSPELKSAVENASNADPEIVERHVDAETLPQPEGTSPLRLRKGQATLDDQQLSDEKNLRADPDTQGILSESITDQNDKLGSSMGEIRRRATPDIVQRSNAEHGQANIDAIKAQDNATVLDMREKYKALEEANGGSMPLDTRQALSGIQEDLSKKLLTKTAEKNDVISEVLDKLRSGTPMTFEEFEDARSNLADVQRNGGSEAKAAAIVRSQLENMPLPPEAAKLKGLADTARAAAKNRFETIDRNPAYEAAVNDNVPKDPNGLHVIGAPSPLADTFMDRYYLGNGTNASRAYVARIKSVMQSDPNFASSIEASTLNKLRDAAGLDEYDSGNFRDASYRNARNAMDKKADVLMSPDSARWTDQLKRVSGYVNHEGKAATVNRSNTALTLQRYGAQYPSTPGIAGTLADYGTDIAAGHMGPVVYAAKKIGSSIYKNAKDKAAIEATRAAKLKFAQDAVAPGAGIETAGSSLIARASGGKVDHEALVERLVQRWKSAKKATDKTTEPLLRVPDSAIVKALDIAQEHI